MDIFRKLFGLPEGRPRVHDDFQRHESPRVPHEGTHLKDDSITSRRNSLNGTWGGNFNVFGDPLEMHRYFEQQMVHILTQFGAPSFGNFFHSFEHPDLRKDNNSMEEYFQHPREHFIKKGHEKPTYEHSHSNQKIDQDLDGKLSITDLDTLFEGPGAIQTDIVPRQSPSVNRYFGAPRGFGGSMGGTFFNQSVQIKTIMNPDGSYETHRTVTDSDGNQETTITQKAGDKEYKILKKRDKEGKEEIEETLINMTEDEKGLFMSKASPQSREKPLFDESLFNKFF